jgi:hypothetical protein
MTVASAAPIKCQGNALTLPQLAIPVVWSAFILWTVRKFWRTPKDPTRKKYDLGAKFYSVAMTAFSATILPSMVIFPDVPYWLEGIVFGLIALPVSLWIGYAISRCFQALDRS